MEYIGNPWVIGVGGGIVSGFIVTLITRYLFSRREQREYRQRVETANNEIIYAIRPSISEKAMPSHYMIDALLSATARKYGVNKTDLHSLHALSNELIKEVMDNTFLSSQQKLEFCEMIKSIVKKDEDDDATTKIEIVRIREKESIDTSVILGATTAILSMLFILLYYIKDRDILIANSAFSKILPVLVLVTIVPIMVYMISDFFKKVKRRQIYKDDSDKSEKVTSITDSKNVQHDETPPHNNANSADAKSRAAD